jgi:hypothetical protein
MEIPENICSLPFDGTARAFALSVQPDGAACRKYSKGIVHTRDLN